MNYSGVRDALVTAISTFMAASYSSTPVFYDNAVVPDFDTVVAPLLKVSVEFQDAHQGSIEATPMTRIMGTLSLSILDREGKGTKVSLQLGDALGAALAYKNLSGVQTSTMRPGHSEGHDGWHLQEFLIDFWTHSTT